LNYQTPQLQQKRALATICSLDPSRQATEERGSGSQGEDRAAGTSASTT